MINLSQISISFPTLGNFQLLLAELPCTSTINHNCYQYRVLITRYLRLELKNYRYIDINVCNSTNLNLVTALFTHSSYFFVMKVASNVVCCLEKLSAYYQ